MDKLRRGESGTPPFRSGRFFNVGNEWFFATREGEDQGPFPSKPVAQAALMNFVRDRGFAHTRRRDAAAFKHESASDDSAATLAGGHSFYW